MLDFVNLNLIEHDVRISIYPVNLVPTCEFHLC